eukprot:COSAG01_NODE_20442_length_949_cov_0.933255_1_plen_156_part_10
MWGASNGIASQEELRAHVMCVERANYREAQYCPPQSVGVLFFVSCGSIDLRAGRCSTESSLRFSYFNHHDKNRRLIEQKCRDILVTALVLIMKYNFTRVWLNPPLRAGRCAAARPPAQSKRPVIVSRWGSKARLVVSLLRFYSDIRDSPTLPGPRE